MGTRRRHSGASHPQAAGGREAYRAGLDLDRRVQAAGDFRGDVASVGGAVSGMKSRKRLEDLERENAGLKRLVAEQLLDIDMLNNS